MTQGTLHGIMDTMVYPNERASWELHEAYYSRPEYAWPLVQYLRMVLGRPSHLMSDSSRSSIWSVFEGTIVEPCVGNGNLVTGLRRYGMDGASFFTGDVRDVGPDAQWIGDWRERPNTWSRSVGSLNDWLADTHLVVTNPPFSLAMEIVKASWRRCPNAAVAILQRSTWYEPTQDRCQWLREHNPDQVTIGRCEFFWPDGSSVGAGDSCSYTWYVWGPDGKGPLGGHHCITPWWEAPAV